MRFPGGEQILDDVRALGEPWTFGVHPESIAGFLARFGLQLEEDLGADDYRRRYGVQDEIAQSGYAFYRLAVARGHSPGL